MKATVVHLLSIRYRPSDTDLWWVLVSPCSTSWLHTQNFIHRL